MKKYVIRKKGFYYNDECYNPIVNSTICSYNNHEEALDKWQKFEKDAIRSLNNLEVSFFWGSNYFYDDESQNKIANTFPSIFSQKSINEFIIEQFEKKDSRSFIEKYQLLFDGGVFYQIIELEGIEYVYIAICNISNVILSCIDSYQGNTIYFDCLNEEKVYEMHRGYFPYDKETNQYVICKKIEGLSDFPELLAIFLKTSITFKYDSKNDTLYKIGFDNDEYDTIYALLKVKPFRIVKISISDLENFRRNEIEKSKNLKK